MNNPTCGRHYETIAQCAERCKISERTIRRAIADGRLKAYGLSPAMIRLDIHEVDQAFAAQ
ncbi:DNA-binding protein [Rhodococcus electrodiphilus]|uniref:helix-turn-helix domain-containing protein n=1 Tax=Rhodococcus ruber TaxID=1830 RepID=UPI0026F41B53|nr:helix-turn-helix domain-containing protein [Rhodococcus ruber]MDO2377443.1 DNA-binding protein [Rhodococcus ruber]